jgi:hypothetical protein
VGWYLPPNLVLKQVNPTAGGRYLAWRASLKFVVPSALALTFARNVPGLGGASWVEILAVMILMLTVFQLSRWIRQKAIFPMD